MTTAPVAENRQRRSPLPTLAERDHLLNVVYGHDPKPPQCPLPGHSNPRATQNECAACKASYLWRSRMFRRFYERGLSLNLDGHVYGDPEPPRCPLKHAYNLANRKSCGHCRARRNWQERQYVKMRRAGKTAAFTDWDVLRSHLRRLQDGGLVAAQIGRAAHCAEITVQRLLTGDLTGRHFVNAAVARRLLAVPVPGRLFELVPDAAGSRRQRVDAVGTHRRIRAACRAGHSLRSQARRLGYGLSTVKSWLTSATVPIAVAGEVAELFPTLITRPGGSNTTVVNAARKGWPGARYFSTTNIDDPGYEPFAIVDDPVGVYRQLRALAWMGQGPQQVAEFIGEAAEQVEIWMEGGPAPAYAGHMVDAAFEALSGSFGPDDRLAERARLLGWAPPLAWYGIDVNNPMIRPRVDVAANTRKNDYPLDSQVLMALMGLVPAAELLPAEKRRVVWKLHKAGWSDRRIGAWLRWNPDGDRVKAADAVTKFREREQINGYGSAVSGDYALEAKDGTVVVPSIT